MVTLKPASPFDPIKTISVKTTSIPAGPPTTKATTTFGSTSSSKTIGSIKLPGTFERTGDRPSGVTSVFGGGSSEPSRPFQGPTRPGTDVEVFRETGVSQPSGDFQGPLPEGVTPEQEQVFRETGVTPPLSELTTEEVKKARLEGEIRIRQGLPPFTEEELGLLQIRENILTRAGGTIGPGTTREPPGLDPTRLQKLGIGAKEFFFGEAGEKFIGFGGTPLGLSSALPPITSREFADFSRERGGLTGKVFAEFIPTTPGGVAIAGGIATAFVLAPPVAQIGGQLLFGGLGVRQAFDVEAPLEKRIAGGILGGISFAGAGTQALPFIKGGFARLSTKFRGISRDQIVSRSKLFPRGRADVIKDISTLTPDEIVDIQLIPKGRGFGFTQKEQAGLIGQRRTITTSARDLFGSLDDVIKIQKGEAGKGLFFTPSLEKGAIGQARVSRLGLADLLKIPKGEKTLGFSPDKPQIVFVRKFKIKDLGFASGELEATIPPGSILTGREVGLTTIAGQKIQIFEALTKLGTGGKTTINIPGLRTTPPTGFISPPTIATGGLSTALTFPTSSKKPPKLTFPSIPTQKLTFPTLPTGKLISGEPFRDFTTPTRQPTRKTPSLFGTSSTNPLNRLTKGFTSLTTKPLSRADVLPTLPTSKKLLAFPILGFKEKIKTPLTKRIFQRTPSFRAVAGKGLGLPDVKEFSKALERTGLSERAFISPKIIKPLGPFKI